jgi:hypothetical protein
MERGSEKGRNRRRKGGRGREGDLGYAHVNEQLGIKGSSESALIPLIDPLFTLRQTLCRGPEQDKPARHDDVDCPVDVAAKRERNQNSFESLEKNVRLF